MDISCTVCHECFAADSLIWSTVCGHAFHQACLNYWQRRSNTCPQCSTVIIPGSINRLFLNIVPQNQKDPFQILESLRKTIELDNLTRSKSIDELSAKLKDTEAAKEKLREEFKNELQVEQQIRRDLNQQLKKLGEPNNNLSKEYEMTEQWKRCKNMDLQPHSMNRNPDESLKQEALQALPYSYLNLKQEPISYDNVTTTSTPKLAALDNQNLFDYPRKIPSTIPTAHNFVNYHPAHMSSSRNEYNPLMTNPMERIRQQQPVGFYNYTDNNTNMFAHNYYKPVALVDRKEKNQPADL